MVLIKDQEVNSLQIQKQFEFDFLVEFWPADPFGGLWIDEDLTSADAIAICFKAQEQIMADTEKFAVEHRSCVKRVRGRLNVKVSPLWWDSIGSNEVR